MVLVEVVLHESLLNYACHRDGGVVLELVKAVRYLDSCQVVYCYIHRYINQAEVSTVP